MHFAPNSLLSDSLVINAFLQISIAVFSAPYSALGGGVGGDPPAVIIAADRLSLAHCVSNSRSVFSIEISSLGITDPSPLLTHPHTHTHTYNTRKHTPYIHTHTLSLCVLHPPPTSHVTLAGMAKQKRGADHASPPGYNRGSNKIVKTETEDGGCRWRSSSAHG